MSYRQTATLGLATLALVSSPVAMASGDGFRAFNGEAGFEYVGTTGSMSRDAVRQDLRASQRSGSWLMTEASPAPMPSALRAGFAPTREEARQAAAMLDRATPSNGWRNLGGEGGWIFEGR